MSTKIRSVTVTTAVRAALAALGECKTKAAMRRLGLTSRAALTREYRQLKAIHSWGDDAKKKYGAQIARIHGLEMLHAIPENVDDLSTFEYCIEELEEALSRATQRPLTKEEIDRIKELNEAEAAQWQTDAAKFNAKWDSIKFAEWITSEGDSAAV